MPFFDRLRTSWCSAPLYFTVPVILPILVSTFNPALSLSRHTEQNTVPTNATPCQNQHPPSPECIDFISLSHQATPLPHPCIVLTTSQLPDGSHLRLLWSRAVLRVVRRVGAGKALLARDVCGKTRRRVAACPSRTDGASCHGRSTARTVSPHLLKGEGGARHVRRHVVACLRHVAAFLILLLASTGTGRSKGAYVSSLGLSFRQSLLFREETPSKSLSERGQATNTLTNSTLCDTLLRNPLFL